MPTPPAPITVPNSLTYRSVAGRTLPLSNLELDKNFAYVENLAEQRLLIGDFTAANIISKLNSNSLSSTPGGVNASEVRGYYPEDDSIGNTLVLRNSNGNFSANIITADTFNGNATSASTATTAVRLQTPRNINGVAFDGTANITISDSTRVSKGGDTLSGKLTLVPSQTSTASLRMQPGVNPTTPVDGDMWATNDTLNIRLGGVSRTLAFTTSNISGFAANVSGIVALTNGGTGANNADTARANLNAAKKGVNADITQLTGLTTPINVAQGGTGITSPGASGNILKSDGTGWYSTAEKSVQRFTSKWGTYFTLSGYNSAPQVPDSNALRNYLDIFPPAGYTMDDFWGGIVSSADAQTPFNSGSYTERRWAYFDKLTDRIRIFSSASWNAVGVSPRVNYFMMWRQWV